MAGRLQLLDCTLRDGGNGLEILDRNLGKNARFTREMMNEILIRLCDTGIDIVEIGNIQQTDDDRVCYAQYQSIEDISETLPLKRKEGQMYTALYRTPDVDLDSVPKYRKGLCEAVRVVLRYSELPKSLAFSAGLAKKGYKVFIQPMVTMRYTDDDLAQVFHAANEMGAYALYFVDSYGCMGFDDIDRLTRTYDKHLDPSIKIGFHAHNNMNMALANAIYFANKQLERDTIIDSCVLGMGLSAGNLQTELIADFLNKACGKRYNIERILKVCEIVNPLYERGLWGYHLEYLVSALQKAAYKYPTDYKENYGMSYSEIYTLLDGMPDDYRFRYTKEYAKDWYKTKRDQEEHRS